MNVLAAFFQTKLLDVLYTCGCDYSTIAGDIDVLDTLPSQIV
jgi:hypothetical protein